MTACPMFAVIRAGQSFRIYGVVYTDSWISQALTEPLALRNGSPDRETAIRALHALQEAVAHLNDWNHSTVAACWVPYHYRVFPAPTRFDTVLEQSAVVQYTGMKDPYDNLFFAIYQGQTHIVKFVPCYGADAHRLLVKLDAAPGLVHCGPMYGAFIPGYSRMQMIVMEPVVGSYIPWWNTTPEFRAKLWAAVEGLHRAGFVHGDLRGQRSS